MGVGKESDQNGCEKFVEFGEKENVCENESNVLLENNCLNQDC